jgi:hypothetical protein
MICRGSRSATVIQLDDRASGSSLARQSAIASCLISSLRVTLPTLWASKQPSGLTVTDPDEPDKQSVTWKASPLLDAPAATARRYNGQRYWKWEMGAGATEQRNRANSQKRVVNLGLARRTAWEQRIQLFWSRSKQMARRDDQMIPDPGWMT